MEKEPTIIINLTQLPKMTLEERVRKALENVEKALAGEMWLGRNWEFPLKLTAKEYLESQKQLLKSLLERDHW